MAFDGDEPKLLSLPPSFGGRFEVNSLHFRDDVEQRCGRCNRELRASRLCSSCTVCAGCHHQVKRTTPHAFLQQPPTWSSVLGKYLNLSVSSKKMDRVMSDCGVKMNALDPDSGLGVLHGLLKACDGASLLQSFLEVGVDAEVTSFRDLWGDRGGRAIHFAASYGRLNCLRTLLNAGVEVDAKAFDGVCRLTARDVGATNQIKLTLELAKPKCLAQLAKEKIWYALRYRMRTGKIRQADLEEKHGGKTAPEWVYHHMVNYEYSKDCEEWKEDLVPFKVMAEMHYRYGKREESENCTDSESDSESQPDDSASGAASDSSSDSSSAPGDELVQSTHQLIDTIKQEQTRINEKVRKAVDTMMEGFQMLHTNTSGSGV